MPVKFNARAVVAWCLTALVAVGVAADSASAQDAACEVFVEQFGTFTGPHDYADDLIDVQWCLDGASVANGGFCAGGTALKLLSSSDDATLRVTLLDDECGEVTLRFVYSQFAQSGTVLKQGFASTSRSLCTASVPAIVGELDTAGGACVAVSHTVALSPGQVVLWRFDHGSPGNTAIFIDEVSIDVTGCCPNENEHACCETGGAGCIDPEIAACVCEIDPYCCENEWDEQCVALVEELQCGSCDAGASSDCLPAFAQDFGDVFSSDSVCSLFPGTFATCGGAGAPFLTNSGACAGTGDAAMAFVAGFPHSYVQTTCLDMAAAVSATLAFNYTKNTATLGPTVQVVFDDDTLQSIWEAPIVFDGGCESVQLDLTPYIELGIVRLRISSGSSIDNGARIDDLVFITSDVSGHDCCLAGEAGCSDAIIQECVCAIDPFCCESQWDELCVISTEFYECADCDLCSDTFAADLNVPDPGGSPCDRFPELFAGCFGTGPLLSNATPCSDDASDYAMVFVPGSEQSATVTQCISLKDADQASVSFEYSKIDGHIGPVLEASADVGGTWVTLWVAPDAPGSERQHACVDLAPAVGLNFLLFRFRSGTPDAAGQVIDDIAFQIGSTCVVPGDVTGDGQVHLADLMLVITNWGIICPDALSCDGDADGDGFVDLADLLMVISNWGASSI